MEVKLAQSSWVDGITPGRHARLRLFCFPHAGGSAILFRAWPEHLPAGIAVCPVQLPGRGNRLREPAYTRLTELMEVLPQALRPYLDVPFAIFGHSMGAVIGFELARRLRALGWPEPRYLFASGHRAPHLPDRFPPVHHLPEPEFVHAVRSLNGTPETVWQHDELRRLLLPLLRADFELIESYRCAADAPLDCPITAFGGLQDDRTTRDELEGWRHHTCGASSVRMLPGDHFFVQHSAPLLLQAVAQSLMPVLGEPRG